MKMDLREGIIWSKKIKLYYKFTIILINVLNIAEYMFCFGNFMSLINVNNNIIDIVHA